MSFDTSRPLAPRRCNHARGFPPHYLSIDPHSQASRAQARQAHAGRCGIRKGILCGLASESGPRADCVGLGAPMIDMEKRRASWRRYNTSPLGQDRAWRYRQTPLYQEAKRRYVELPKGQDTAWRYEYDNLDRQARNNRHTPAAREREQIKRRRKVRELAADNLVRDAAQYRLAQANRGKAING